jgi:hypothetical protein
MMVTGEAGDRYLIGQCGYCNLSHWQSAPGYPDVGFTGTGSAPEPPAPNVGELAAKREALLEQAAALQEQIDAIPAPEPLAPEASAEEEPAEKEVQDA